MLYWLLWHSFSSSSSLSAYRFIVSVFWLHWDGASIFRYILKVHILLILARFMTKPEQVYQDEGSLSLFIHSFCWMSTVYSVNINIYEKKWKYVFGSLKLRLLLAIFKGKYLSHFHCISFCQSLSVEQCSRFLSLYLILCFYACGIFYWISAFSS